MRLNNLYSYVANDPLARIDPNGHFYWSVGDKAHGELVTTDLTPDRVDRAEDIRDFRRYQAGIVFYAAQKHHHPHPHKPKSQKQVAGTIYNKTSALRPTADKGNGSAINLSEGRIGMAQVIEINNSKERVASSTVRDTLKNPDAKEAWEDSLDAAKNAGNEADGTNGATHFYLNAGQATKPDWYNQGEIEESFGPFRVANDTKEFKAGEEVDIEIVVSPAPR